MRKVTEKLRLCGVDEALRQHLPGVRAESGQFVVLAEDKKSAIEIAWESADSQFQITTKKPPT